ncbi:right-handed parallel beta-helix repeat-containing protein [Flammeovirga aprica]|uniref:Uncharacterized protein n=1 Tax=Flammeovirga aprica JL-4 TaxID=694437 RepID=A0A7X9XCH2_9BACT|nr:hypothetical protein [Flammeovirga aprica]NME71743.1 hypothetical protein [Flammeovirga aprica JL-4]
MSKKLIKPLLWVLSTIVLLNSCDQKNTEKQEETEQYSVAEVAIEEEVVVPHEFPKEESQRNIELVFDSVSIDKYYTTKHMIYKHLYFSDQKGVQWVLYTNLEDNMNGFFLNDGIKSSIYEGVIFKVKWNFERSKYMENGIEKEKNFAFVEELHLASPERDLKRRTIELTADLDIEELIDNAHAGDSILIRAGVYILTDGSRLDLFADHIVLKGEPGVFIYGDKDVHILNIHGNDVTVDNLYLSHTLTIGGSCGGDVVSVSSESQKFVIRNCDLNGCGVTGVYF